MNEIFKSVHRASKKTLIAGAAIITAILVASVVLYIGAGRFLDYYPAIDASEKLLASVRPLSALASAGSIALEYSLRRADGAGK